MNNNISTNTLLLLANGFEVLEASAFIDVLGWNRLEGDGSTKLTTCGKTREIKSSFGQTWKSDILLKDVRIEEYTALAIPGGFEEFEFYEDAFSKEFSEIIKRFHSVGKPIFSICTGALPIAKSGILEGKVATTYSKSRIRIDMLEGFGVKVSIDRICKSNNITTSADPSTALEVAFLLLESLTSVKNTYKVKSLMGFSV
ncbi:MAG: DJ-1/PfpI family protein [Candidatus Kapaibacteriales bacterium]